MKTNLKARWSTLAIAVAAATGVSVTVAQELQPAAEKLKVVERSVEQRAAKVPVRAPADLKVAQRSNRYLIEFVEPSVATYKGGIAGFAATSAKATGRERIDLNARPVQSYAEYLEQRQNTVMAEINQRVRGLKVQANLTLTFNGVIVEHFGGDLKEQLRGVPGVKAVHEDAVYEVHMDASNDLISAPDLWTKLGGQASAGAGINVAVVDSGITFDHPMFGDNGHEPLAVAAGDDYCAANAELCNDKLAVARFYPSLADVHPDEFLDSPWDFNGHGTHVAGTAVGNPVSATFNGVAVNFSGVAPGANLFVYKAMYSRNDGLGSGSTLSLAQALEDAASDGAHVINNSWGGGAGSSPANSYYTPIMQALDEMGVVTVTSAGNSGPGPVTVGCPGCIEETITVASTQTGRDFVNQLDVTGFEPIQSWLGNGNFEVNEAITADLLPASQVDEANIEACNAFAADAFAGQIALVSRGSCSFEQKANMVQDAGAVGVVVYNTDDSIIIMSMGAATLPGVSIINSAGLAIEEAWEAGMQATLNPNTKAIDADFVDVMSGFSSRGPNGDASILKPEIAAPGSDILSAAPGPGLAMMSGTSMAGPHVAGAAALVLASYEDLKPQQVKSILMTSAKGGVKKEDAETPADPFDVGAGRLELSQVTDVGVTFDRPSFANDLCVNVCNFTRTLTNLRDSASEWSVDVAFTNPNVTVTYDDSVSLDANGTAEFAMEVNGSMAGEGWQFGTVTFSDNSGTAIDAKLPIAIYTALSENSTALSSGITAGEAIAGSDITQSIFARMGNTEAPVTLTAQLPADENFVIAEDSITVTENLSSTTSSEFDATARTYTWTGEQQNKSAVTLGIATSSFPYAGLSLDDLAAMGIGHYKACTEGCDENIVTFDLAGLATPASWQMEGQDYGSLVMWTNGIVEVGERRVNSTYAIQGLPNPALPNGIVAPLWTDFEFVAGEGELRYTLVNAGADRFLILEWYKARAYVEASMPESDNGARYTFNAWFRLNTDEVYVNYIDINGVEPPFWGSVIGIENMTGTEGGMIYAGFNGYYPADGDAIVAALKEGELAEVQVDMGVTVPTFGDVAAATASGSHSRGLAIDLTDETSGLGREFLTMMNVSSNGVSYDAVLPLNIEPQGAVALETVAAPAHGSVSFNGMVATYNPPALWVGDDSFSYRVVDENGSVSTENTVAVSITNEAPSAVASAPANVGADASVVLDASGSTDADGDSLTYRWQLINGPTISLANANTARASFTAPRVDETSEATFLVTVSDGIASAQQTVTVTIERHSSGSFGWLFILLGLPLVWLRKRVS